MENKEKELLEKILQLEAENKRLREQTEDLEILYMNVSDHNTFIENELDDKLKLIEEANKKITDSVIYAQRIQNAVLPNLEELKSGFEDAFVFFRSKDIVSGDFYWYQKYGNYALVSAVDCTGHGVPGAFMSLLGVSFLNEIVTNFNENQEIIASEILDQLREFVKNALKQTGKEDEAKDGMDMALCVFDFEKNILQYAGAHNPLLIIRNKQIIQYKPDRMPIGIHIKETPFKNNIIEIKKGDKFYIFSDGYIDQFGGEKGRKFRIKNLKNLLIEHSDKPMQTQKYFLTKALEKWQNPSEEKQYSQLDDILVIGLKI